MINWQELMKYERLKYASAGEAERFRMFLYKLIDAPYIWGAENLFGTDCSGTVCWAFYLMGYNVRVTADYLFKHIFNIHVKKYDDLNKILSVFYVDENDKAVHVTPVVGSYVVLDADGTMIRTRTARAVSLQHKKYGHDVVWRELDQKALSDVSLSGDYVYGLDPELALLRS